MFSFNEFLVEKATVSKNRAPAVKKTKAPKPPKEDSNLNDDKGKLAELYLAHHLGKHLVGDGEHYYPSHYREDERFDKKKKKYVGGTPQQVESRIIGRRGSQLQDSVHGHSAQTAEAVIQHLIKTGRITDRRDIQGVHWTSQADTPKKPGDHEKLTGIKDPSQKGDLIMTVRGKDGKPDYIPISAKYGSENKPNYANWGLDRLGNESGMESHPVLGNKLEQIKAEHDKELEDTLGHVYGEKAGAFTGEQKHALFKVDRDLRDEKIKNDREVAAGKAAKRRWTPNQLQRIANADVAYAISQKHRRRMASALADSFNQRAQADGNDSHMRGFISKSISEPTKYATVIAHSKTDKKDPYGDAESRVYDQADVAPHVLSKYDGIHAKVATSGEDDEDGGAISVHFYGKNKKTGAIENVATQSIKAGSGPYKGANGTFKIQHSKEDDRDPNVEAPTDRVVQDKETGEQHTIEPTVPDSATVWGPKKLLSQVRTAVPPTQRRVPQTGSPFQSMSSPGIRRPEPSRKLSPEGIPEHMHQGHRDTDSYMGYKL